MFPVVLVKNNLRCVFSLLSNFKIECNKRWVREKTPSKSFMPDVHKPLWQKIIICRWIDNLESYLFRLTLCTPYRFKVIQSLVKLHSHPYGDTVCSVREKCLAGENTLIYNVHNDVFIKIMYQYLSITIKSIKNMEEQCSRSLTHDLTKSQSYLR